MLREPKLLLTIFNYFKHYYITWKRLAKELPIRGQVRIKTKIKHWIIYPRKMWRQTDHIYNWLQYH